MSSTKMSENEMKKLAAQLRKPEGLIGVEVAEEIYKTNRNIIRSTIDLLGLKGNDLVLEIGHGNGSHIDSLFQKEMNIIYHGLELSKLMHNEAQKINQPKITSKRAYFQHYNGKKFPYNDRSFDKIFTINTLYFWDDPIQFLAEVRRVLKDNGLFSVTFASEETLAKLPVTQYGFTSYSKNGFSKLMTDNHFTVEKLVEKSETIVTHEDESENREFFIGLIKKN